MPHELIVKQPLQITRRNARPAAPGKFEAELTEQIELLRGIRSLRQMTPEWKAIYDKRAGVEGTMSQGAQAFGLRTCRYIGLAKTRLQHVVTAAAINMDRLAAWLDGRPHAKTRVSRFAALYA